VSTDQERKVELQVGIFVTVAIVLGAIVTFVVGSQRNLFSSKTDYQAVFDDVGGLRAGGPVLVGGVAVGSVKEVSFMEDGRILVRFTVINDLTRLIRGRPPEADGTTAPEASHARIGSKGLLGDRLLEVTAGDMALPEWNADLPLPVESGPDLMTAAKAAIGDVQATLENIRLATDPFRDQEFSNDMKETAHNLAAITGMVATGNGALRRLITDPATGDDLAQTLDSVRATSGELAQTARAVREVAQEVQNGDGSAHRLLYGDELVTSVSRFGDMSGEVATLLRDVRTGDGTVHDLVYGNAGEEMIANLTRASEDIAHIVADVRAGRGTIGGLLTDPSIYEDVKRLVGDLQRNEILRALVRYSIRRDDAREHATHEDVR
jgi:phospholipid/cholesterol/gamma-HCH transport system substrate-binding protein